MQQSFYIGILNYFFEEARAAEQEQKKLQEQPSSEAAVLKQRRKRMVWYGVAVLFFVLCVVAYVLYRVYSVPSSDAASFGGGTGLANSSKPGLGSLFVVGLLAGLVTFGGAYTTIPFVRVESLLWIPSGVFLDSIALAQIIPTPLVMFITFIGFMGGGIGGALLMTLGVFLPAFSFTLIGHNLFEKIVEFRAVRAVLDGITASVIGQVAITAFELIRDTAAQSTGLVIVFVLSLAALYQIISPWTAPGVIISAALVGQVLFPVAASNAANVTATIATALSTSNVTSTIATTIATNITNVL